jgi:hypothetical protein
MGKFPFKRPRIISKKFPEIDSSIDGVTKSLNDLVFSYHEQVSRALSKKHWMMAFSSVALILVLGSFISLRGKAESSIFYPETCLGGWINPENAEGEQQTTSNGDESQFTKDNSAILPKNTNAEMYCGNFKGKFDAATKPTKIMVSLALTKGADLLQEDTLESGLAATSTKVTITDVASSTATTTLLQASSTAIDASSTVVTNGTSTPATTSSSTGDAATSTVGTAQAIPGTAVSSGPSVVDGIVKSVQSTINDIFGGSDTKASQTDTVVVPAPAPATDTQSAPTPTPQETPTTTTTTPTSYIQLKNSFVSQFVETVFAQEDTSAAPASSDTQAAPQVTSAPAVVVTTSDVASTTVTPTPQPESTPTVSPVANFFSTSTPDSGTSTDSLFLIGTSTASSTSLTGGTTTKISTADPAVDNQFQNNFLEVFYTFDGVTWTSLGELNEISMKYRTFEIPVTASTSWSDLAHLQIKVQAKKRDQDTPTVYLDGIKVEVLYDSVIEHTHPDFARDTILKDETVAGIRMVTIINNDTKEQEIWYMRVDDNVASSTLNVATSTGIGTTSPVVASDTNESLPKGTSTLDASSTDSKAPILEALQHRWKKYTGKDLTIPTANLIEEINKQEDSEKTDQADLLPDFASDTIKRMKGVSSHEVLVQIERGTEENPRDELWLYDTTTGTEERIGKSTTTASTIAVDSPIGAKGGYLFWLSIDRKNMYAYSLENKTVLEQKIPEYNADKGERAEVTFDGISWKAIVNNEGFSFYSPETGEVFSDEDSGIVETLRSAKKLDVVLNKEELSKLNLPVSADVSTTTQK